MPRPEAAHMLTLQGRVQSLHASAKIAVQLANLQGDGDIYIHDESVTLLREIRDIVTELLDRVPADKMTVAGL